MTRNELRIDKLPNPYERKFAEDRHELFMSGFYYKKLMNVGKCIDVNSVLRNKHSYDKDGRCLFCEEKI